MKISIIIPVLNESANIRATLSALQAFRGDSHEIILVDGGSSDDTVELAQPLVDKIVYASKGRAAQMNEGARQASGDIYWFLHGDTVVPQNAGYLIEHQINKTGKHWGRFNVRLSGSHVLFRLIESMMNLRSRITGIATGDQGIFVERDSFNKMRGYKSITLMEDIEISRRLLRECGRPVCLRDTLLTSSRRWENNGIIKTVFLMWRLRLAYFLGRDPSFLAERYSKN